MKLAIVLLLTLLLAVPVAAASKKKCPPSCKHRTSACALPQKSLHRDGAVLDALLQGFEVSAGFRWQTEQECPTLEVPDPPLTYPDPFYVGVGVRLPLSPGFGLFGAFDRDFTDEARWQARTGVSFFPFAR